MTMRRLPDVFRRFVRRLPDNHAAFAGCFRLRRYRRFSIGKRISGVRSTGLQSVLQSDFCKQRSAGFARLLEKVSGRNKAQAVKISTQPARRSEPSAASRDQLREKRAVPNRRRKFASTGDCPAVKRRSETDPEERSGERRNGQLDEGDHVAACAATPGPDDKRAARFLADVPLRCPGGRSRLRAARDVAPHNAPYGLTTAERGNGRSQSTPFPASNVTQLNCRTRTSRQPRQTTAAGDIDRDSRSP